MKVGDIIDGRRVTRIYTLCGGTAYESEPVTEEPKVTKVDPEPEEKPKKRIRKKKEQ